MTPFYVKVPKELKANIAFRKGLLRRCDDDETFRADFIEMCRRDILFFFNVCCFVFEPRDARVFPFITYPFQDPAIMAINDSIGVEDVCLFKSRDMGASWIAMTVAVWRWLFFPRQTILCMSRREDLVDSTDNPSALMWKMDFIINNLPEWMIPVMGFSDRTNLHCYNPENHSVIDGESTTESSTVSDRRLWVIGDEIGHYPDGGAPFMQKSRDVTRSRLLIGTPNGTGNALAEIVEQGRMKIIRLPWYEHPEKSKGLYISDGSKAKPDHPGKKRSPWYDEQCARALHPTEIASELDMDFLGSGFQFFDGNELTSLAERMCREPTAVGEVYEDLSGNGDIKFAETANGALWMWGERVKGHYVIGCDISQGTGTSNSAAAIVHLESGIKVAELAVNDLRPDEFADYVVNLCRYFHDAFLIWEDNGGGGQHFKTQVVRRGYRNFYYRRQEDRLVPTPIGDKPGFHTTGPLKIQLAGAYRKAMLESKYIERSRRTLDECRQYVQKGRTIVHMKSQASRNPADEDDNHGDLAIASWLAVFAANLQMPEQKPGEVPEIIPYGCVAWYMREEQKKREEGAWWPDRERGSRNSVAYLV